MSEGRKLRIVISDGGQKVAIPEEGIRGRRVGEPAAAAVFDLDEGTFAGGRFVVWGGPAGLEAELTVFGSGVPILSSERGTLRLTPHGAQ
ncbi:MAG: hypothetical protein HC897_14125 [Thermoanaerobaculia bacterium]|nr:hypothetical protein [Thermoanaerobaculia bacterium]